jgi:hypothetical protein
MLLVNSNCCTPARESELLDIECQETIAVVGPEIAPKLDVIEAIYTCCEETRKPEDDANRVD